MLSNLQCKQTFSVLKKSRKNEYICPSDICLSDIITSSSIRPIIFSIYFFISKEDWKLPQYSCNCYYVIIILSNFDRIRKSTLFFKATLLSSPSDIILLTLTHSSKQEFMENIYHLLSSTAKFTRLLYLKLMLI